MAVDQGSGDRGGKYTALLSKFDIAVSSLSLFLITGYAPFAIAALLADRMPGVPAGFIVSAVFLSMAVGTVFSCYWTGTGLIVGPAVGLASFVSQTSAKTISTGQFVVASFAASLIALILSIVKSKSKGRSVGEPERQLSLRQAFLDSMPEPVKIGVRGGIGSLLAAAAIHGLQEVSREFPSHYSFAVNLFVGGTFALLVTEVLQERLDRYNAKNPSDARDWAIVMLRLFGALLPLLWLFLLYREGIFHVPTISFKWQLPSFFPLFNVEGVTGTPLLNALVVICFSFVILFVFLIDIPGSPYDFLKKKSDSPATVGAIIDRSFVVTSTTSMLNPLLGLYTSVYYAENHAIVRRDDSTVVASAATGWICSILFMLLAIGFLLADLHVGEMKLWILIALAPSLFTVGVRMTARALKQESEEGKVPSYYYVPAALTLLLTHFIGFEIALPIGVVYYGAYRWAADEDMADDKKDRKDQEPKSENWFNGLVFMSLITVLVLGAIRLGYG